MLFKREDRIPLGRYFDHLFLEQPGWWSYLTAIPLRTSPIRTCVLPDVKQSVLSFAHKPLVTG